MSRLLNPGLGDFVDRWLVLDLKLADYMRRRGRHADHFMDEQMLIGRALRELTGGSLVVLDTPAARRLEAVHKRLWHLTQVMLHDQLLPTKEDAEIATVARELFALNEERAQLVATLSQHEDQPEKIR